MLGGSAAGAADAISYFMIRVPTDSDVVVSVPFNKGVANAYTVAADPAGGTAVAVDEELPADTYDAGCYLRFTSGAGVGPWSTISANAPGELNTEEGTEDAGPKTGPNRKLTPGALVCMRHFVS